MDELLIKMSLSDMPRFVNDDNPELAIARCMFLSTRPNSHGLVISEEVLAECAKTILGKFLIGNLNLWENDVTTHLQDPDIFGYFPTEQEIEFVRADDGYLDAYANAVVSKIYATKVYDLFTKDNFRNVSVEMTVTYANEEDKIVSAFRISGLTVLAISVNPSCPNAHMEIIRFSADEAEKYYQQNSVLGKMEKLASVGKRYKVNKTAKAMSNDDWSNVDKTKLRNTILEAQNTASLVKSVYLKVEKGWEDAPSEKLGYPVMQLKGDTFVYNRNALANAKARAEQQNETEVLSKLSSIYDKLNLNNETSNKESEEKMAKLDEKEKDVVMEKPTDEEEVKAEAPKDEEVEPTEEEKASDEESKEEEAEKLAEESDEEKDEEKDDKEEDEKDEKEEDDKEKLSCENAKLTAQVAEFEAKMSEMESELEELRKFKADTEEEKKMSIVLNTLAEVKEVMDESSYVKFEETGKECTLETVNAWRNEVLANVTTVLMSKKDEESHLRMGVEQESKSQSLWDRF